MGNEPFAAIDLARYAVSKCYSEGEPVTNLLLQKMLYFLQYVFCSNTGGELLFGDEFEAWPYGPVLPEVYREYSFYGASPIEESYDDADLPSLGEYRDFIDEGIVDLRRRYPWDLVRVTHAVGSPWWRAKNEGSRTIGNDLIIKAATA